MLYTAIVQTNGTQLLADRAANVFELESPDPVWGCRLISSWRKGSSVWRWSLPATPTTHGLAGVRDLVEQLERRRRADAVVELEGAPPFVGGAEQSASE